MPNVNHDKEIEIQDEATIIDGLQGRELGAGSTWQHEGKVGKGKNKKRQ